MGIAPDDDVFTSAMAVATLVHGGERVLACAGAGVIEALQQRDVDVIAARDCGAGAPPRVDVVIVGKDDQFTYGSLRAAGLAIRAGARLLATNTDATYPTPTGLEPGAGSLLAAVVTAGGRQPDAVAGKPHQAMADLIGDHVGQGDGIVVGDRLDTDGAFAQRLGFGFVLVLTGVTSALEAQVDANTVVTASLGDAVTRFLSP
jgi:ribonucleotide monophosphatase NagD (HAD superfamily)